MKKKIEPEEVEEFLTETLTKPPKGGSMTLTITTNDEENAVEFVPKDTDEFYSYEIAKALIAEQCEDLELCEDETVIDDRPQWILREDKQRNGEFEDSCIGKIVRVRTRPDLMDAEELFEKFEQFVRNHRKIWFPTKWPEDFRLYFDIAFKPGLIMLIKNGDAYKFVRVREPKSENEDE